MCKRFKTVLYIGKANPLDNRSVPAYKPQYVLEFSKNKIYFTDSVLKVVGAITNTLHPFNGKNGIRHTDRYELIKLEDDDVDRMKGFKFQIKLLSGVTFNIKSGGLEGIKMRWIHKKYWPQRNFEKISTAIITIICSIISGIVVGVVTYNLGYNSGLKKAEQSLSQDSTIKTDSINQQKTRPNTNSTQHR